MVDLGLVRQAQRIHFEVVCVISRARMETEEKLGCERRDGRAGEAAGLAEAWSTM